MVTFNGKPVRGPVFFVIFARTPGKPVYIYYNWSWTSFVKVILFLPPSTCYGYEYNIYDPFLWENNNPDILYIFFVVPVVTLTSSLTPSPCWMNTGRRSGGATITNFRTCTGTTGRPSLHRRSTTGGGRRIACLTNWTWHDIIQVGIITFR